jgi:hypothetical protein
MPPLPEELTSTLIKGQWSTSKRESDHFKRSIYLFSRRNLRYPIFEAFDRPDGNASCPVRSRSTTAPQSLVLLNSEFSLLSARHLAGRLQEEASDRDTQVQLLFKRALSRQPTNAELSAIIDFLARQQESLSQDERWPEMLAQPAGAKPSDHSVADAALVDACLAIFNSNEFLYLD